MALEKVIFKKARPEAKLPTWAYDSAAGADVYACLPTDTLMIPPHSTVIVPLGIKSEFSPGYGAFIYARSGTATKKGIAPANKVGLIDADYRGEWIFPVHNHTNIAMTIENGERIGQVVFHKVEHPEFVLIDDDEELSETKRGEGKLNSSGIK